MAPTPQTDDPTSDPCRVVLPVPGPCCISPCDPPWLPDKQCIVWYETKYLHVPIGDTESAAAPPRFYIEFRIIYAHRLCLLGKQHGPLLFTVTLLPGEKVTLYHSERYRQTTSVQDRYSVQTTFMQYLSVIHQARVTNTLNLLSDKLASVKGSASVSVGGGLGGLLGLPSGSSTVNVSTTDHNVVQVGFASDQFNQSVFQASQLTHAERSVVVSNTTDKQTADVTSRTIQNDNACRAVTYFVRKIVELYSLSTTVVEISYRVIAPNVPSDFHSIADIGWLPPAIQTQIKNAIPLLPKVGETVGAALPISIPTDGTVYDPELAHCCSCEPERKAALELQLEMQKAEALKACREAQLLELELERRTKLLAQGQLAPFDVPQAQGPAPGRSS